MYYLIKAKPKEQCNMVTTMTSNRYLEWGDVKLGRYTHTAEGNSSKLQIQNSGSLPHAHDKVSILNPN
jgi:hypothetical protein